MCLPVKAPLVDPSSEPAAAAAAAAAQDVAMDGASEEGEVVSDGQEDNAAVAKGWRFAWPIELHRTMCVPHTVAFGRAVLEEWCEVEGVEFKSAVVKEA